MRCIVICLVFSGLLSLSARATTQSLAFGDAMPAGESLHLTDAISRMQDNRADSFTGKIVGEISEVCQKKGCFMVLTAGEFYARVTFKDYGFFVPKDSAGQPATVFGKLVATTLTADQANHYEADAGRTGTYTTPKTEYSIVASAVVFNP